MEELVDEMLETAVCKSLLKTAKLCLNCGRPVEGKSYCNAICRNKFYITSKKYRRPVTGIGRDGCAPIEGLEGY